MQRSDKLNLAEVKFAVEAIEMDETVKNRFTDERIARAKNKLKDDCEDQERVES